MFRLRMQLFAPLTAVVLTVVAGSPTAAQTPVDPATLVPPPPAESNAECERVGNRIICELAFTDPLIVDEPSGVVCGTTELLFSQERSVIGKRFYDADGLLLTRHFHEYLTWTFTNPLTGATVTASGQFMNRHDLAVAGDVATGETRSSGSIRFYDSRGGVILVQSGHLVIDEATGTVIAESGPHPFEDYFLRGDLSALDPLCDALV